jgi:hypothetical protein
LAALGAAVFAVLAIGQPLRFVLSNAPVDPSWAGMAFGAALAGIPMAALLAFLASMALGGVTGRPEREQLARRCAIAGLIGFGVCSFGAGLALVTSWALNGMSTVHLAGAWVVIPSVAVLLGSSLVVTLCIFQMEAAGVWTAFGRMLWGLLGVMALTAGVPMLIDSGLVDDSRALFHRFNMFVVIYPVLWAAYAATALALVYCGLRCLRFALSAGQPDTVHRNADNPPSTGNTWPVTYDASSEIKNKAA